MRRSYRMAHQCPWCPIRFTWAGELSWHMREDHVPASEDSPSGDSRSADSGSDQLLVPQARAGEAAQIGEIDLTDPRLRAT
jgi:hypothetical protein